MRPTGRCLLPRRSPPARATPLAMALALALAGCAPGFWGAGLSNDVTPTAASTANGMVVTLGPPAWNVASQTVANKLLQAFPEGLLFDSLPPTRAVPPNPTPPAELHISFQGARMTTGPLELAVDPLGLVTELSVGLEPLVATVSLGEQPLCDVTVSMEHGVLSGRLSLTRTKLGSIQASALPQATLDAPDALVDLSACPDVAGAEGSGMGPLPEARGPVLDAIAREAFAALAPQLAATVPQALGLNLVADITSRFGTDGIGDGLLRARVRASEAEQDNWWQLAEGNLNVPYAVAIESRAHPCVPDEVLIAPGTTAVPQVLAGAAVLVSRGVLAHAVRSLWRAGGLCGERVGRTLSWPAAELKQAWPTLGELRGDAPITLRVWPVGAPQVSLADVDGAVVATLSTELWTVELYGELDGARVRLATLQLALEIDGQIEVGASRAVWLTPQRVVVTATGSSGGLFEAPGAELAEALAAPLAEDLLSAAPLWWLPTLPLGPQDAVSLATDYVVFASRDEPDTPDTIDTGDGPP